MYSLYTPPNDIQNLYDLYRSILKKLISNTAVRKYNGHEKGS